MRWILPIIIVASFWVGGCAPAFNHTEGEADSLSEIKQLTTDFERAGEAYFSPDMDWIIFQAVPRGEKQYQMYIARLYWEMDRKPIEGLPPVVYNTPLPMNERPTVPVKSDRVSGLGRPIRISPEASRNSCGFFSPDGNSILFASTTGKEDPNEPAGGYQRDGSTYRWTFPKGMEIYRADGWLGAIAVAEPNKIVNLAQHALTHNDAYDAECAYSPDGKFIVFTSDRDGDGDIFVMHADGTGQRAIVKAPNYDGGAFFSPDGKRLVYHSDRKGDSNLQIYTADLMFDDKRDIVGTMNERQLTDDNSVNWGPYWHPDGRHIIYATSVHGLANYELYMMRDDGSRKTRITFTDGADVFPVISPDGKHLMWASKRTNDKSTQVFIARFAVPKGS